MTPFSLPKNEQPESASTSPMDEKPPFDENQKAQLRSQVEVYRLLARNQPVPPHLTSRAVHLPQTTLLPDPYGDLIGEGEKGEKMPYDLAKVFQFYQDKNEKRVTSLVRPTGIDPQHVLKEREHRIQNRIGLRIKELRELPADIGPRLRTKAEIEMRSLRLLNLQKQIRREVLGQLKKDTMLETALNPFAYRRTKRQALREARITEKLEKQQKIEAEKRRRHQHLELLQMIVQHGKEFREFHKNNLLKHAKMRKAISTYHANNERERKKDELRNEKMRMMKLMQEDEEGYRQMLDEKKDRRLVFLLSQTDDYVNSLTGLVRKHQLNEKKKKAIERKEAKNKDKEEIRVHVRDCETGEILHGMEAPKADEIDAWMETHPGYEVVSRDEASSASDSGEEEDDEPIEGMPNVQDSDDKDEYEGLDEEQRNKKILERARNEEDEYAAKSRSQMESYYATAHRIVEKIVKQHSSLGGGDPNLQLKPYQLEGLEWMVSLYNNNLNGILADEMGLGKTIQTVALITYLMEVKKVNGPYLIIVPLSTISNWHMELEKWAPHVVAIIYKGDKEARKRMETAIKKDQFNVLLTTYDYVLKEKAVLGKKRWKYMIIDEGHRMKNHNCKLTLTLNGFFSAQHRLLLTGTPLQNKLPELWALLNFLLPSIFSSCGTFEQWFNAPFSTTGEKVELNQEETMLIIRRLHKVLRPFLLRRLKKEVEAQLPEKTEKVLKCDMSSLQRILYRHMKNGYLIDNKHTGGRALMNTVIHLRKLCNHPFLFPNVEEECREFWKTDITGRELYRVSGKFELLDRILPKLKATGHRVLIFCQMTSCMTIMEDYFTFKGWRYLRLDGSTKPDDRGLLLSLFNAENSEFFIFMLSTRAGGLGLNLQTADTVIIFDSDWNPHQDMQAQDRAHRIGQKREVRVLRMITVSSVEEKIYAAASHKLKMDEKVIQAGKFDQRSTGAERKLMLEQILREELEEDDEDEVPDDETINQMVARSEDEFELFQRFDIDRRRQEASELRRKPRLIEDDEIPPNIIRASEQFDQIISEKAASAQQSAEEAPQRRKRKEVDYSQDLLSDREWLKSIDDGNDEESTPPPKKRKKASNVDPELSERFTSLIDTLISYKTSSGRELALPFVQLPSRKELPNYYDVIEKPMDLNRITRKIREGKYQNITGITSDIRLLAANARKYNADGSELYNDSLILEAAWNKLVEMVALAPQSTSETEASSSHY
ncbi:hypothetical protein QR680_016138 [Steinernema hermaphroditum]|uniref:Uncharacterized protein n=1 Tax=Steinernema hermaphroditum TaxID=289476 RepID=A0AA39HB90_9BILA|nr:hypothetical protein QR680_016138 [Steinernema hermaphroditum]